MDMGWSRAETYEIKIEDLMIPSTRYPHDLTFLPISPALVRERETHLLNYLDPTPFIHQLPNIKYRFTIPHHLLQAIRVRGEQPP